MASKAPKKTPAARKAAAPAKPSAIDDVRQLVKLMVDNELGEVSVQDGARSIVLKRGSAAAGPAAAAPVAASAPAASPAAAAPAAREEEPADAHVEIKSPMVGTMYVAPSPDSDPYVTVGSYVDENTVVCIVEAMKVMNEVRAETSGIITEVCVKNAQPVEYGQVLFRVRPA
jgi:acetyl-CoA carboxylase biotin carboxyl carrier protein